MLNVTELAHVRNEIAERFIRQCRDGPQSAALGAGTRACGQLLGETESTQHGLHGTAAAIRVLATYDDHQARELIPELVRYIEDRESVEPPERPDRVHVDSRNVIKVSETLYALHHVDAAVARTEELRARLAKALLDGMVAGQGWNYYTDRVHLIEPLPTALATQALATEGYPVDGPVQSLLATVSGNSGGKALGAADVSVRVLCVYVLSFGKGGEALAPVSDLETAFSSLWAQLASLLKDYDIEQNIEYQRDGTHHYVRVPWQLYLIALAAQLAPFRSFAARAVQARLASILGAGASPGGFFYPHSGSRVSARTNAILYEVLALIERRLPQLTWMLRPGAIIDRVINSRATAWTARGVALLLIVISIASWTRGRTTGIGALAPDLLSALLLVLLSARRPR